MRALTICEPMASAIVFGGKDIENRTRRLGIEGVTLIHAGRSLRWFEMSEWVHERWPECPAWSGLAVHQFRPRLGMAIGVAYFGRAFEYDAYDGAKWQRASRWATGPWCHRVLGVTPIEAFPLIGRQGPFNVPASALRDDVIAAAEALEERWRDAA